MIPVPFVLSINAAAGRPFVPLLRRQIREAHGILKPALAQLSLALVSDCTMAELHLRFLGIPGPTDVLTFPIDFNETGQIISGEVVLCVPEARRRSRIEGTTPGDELLLYAVHGLLHLCGFDDRTDRQFKAMHRREDQILTELGIGPIFQPIARPVKNRRGDH